MSEFKFQMVQSWGIASARHTSGRTVPLTGDTTTEFLFDVPLGPSIVRWDIQSQTRVLQFQAHRDLVTCMRVSPDLQYVATSCHSGEVKLWSVGLECVGEVMAPMKSQFHDSNAGWLKCVLSLINTDGSIPALKTLPGKLAWSPDSARFVVVGNGFNSSVVMYSVQLEGSKPVLKQLWQVKATEEVKDQGSEVRVQRSEDSEEATTRRKSEDVFYMAEIAPSGNTVAVKETGEGSTVVQLFSVEGKLLRSTELRLNGGDKKLNAVLMSTYNNGCYAVCVQGGHVFFIAADTLDVINIIETGFTSRSCVWDGDDLVLPSDSGKLVWWSPAGEKLCEFTVGSADYIVRLDWSVSGHALWMCGFGTLSYLQVKRNDKGSVISVSQSHTIHFYDITCCGVAFSPSGQSLASGDLGGNVAVTQKSDIMPVHKCSVGTSVRCLVWRGEGEVLVGCLDGLVHRWNVGAEPKVLFAMEGSIIHMRWNHTNKCLAVGTSKGVLGVYDMSRDFPCPQAVFTAHSPKKGRQDLQFGQLTRQAEIWSACWGPEDTMVATCSEDQTTKIWRIEDWQCITTLHGHTMAVTSVDWKRVGMASLLATCSDDRTIRLTDGESFQLLKILNTTDIYGWYTLTYLAFDPGTRNVHTMSEDRSHMDSPLLVVTTQNGHVVVWNTQSGHKVTQGRLHCGSIEGLVWDKTSSCLATVGADCVVHMFKLNV